MANFEYSFENKMKKWVIHKWRRYYIDYAKLKSIITSKDQSVLQKWARKSSSLLLNNSKGNVKSEPVESNLISEAFDDYMEKEVDIRVSQGFVSSILSLFEQSGAGEEGMRAKDTNPRTAANSMNNDATITDQKKHALFRKEVGIQILKAHEFFNTTLDYLESEFQLLQSQGKQSLEDLGVEQTHATAAAVDSNNHHEEGVEIPTMPNPMQTNTVGVTNSNKFKKKLRRASVHVVRQNQSSERAFIELNYTVSQLENFAVINHSAVIKILKKHDEVLNATDERVGIKSLSSYAEKLEGYTSFINPQRLFDLKQQIQIKFADFYCHGSMELAKAELFMKRSHRNGEGGGGGATSLSSSFAFRLGSRIGMCIILFIWVVWDVILDFAVLDNAQQEAIFEQCHAKGGDAFVYDNDTVIKAWFEKDFPIYRGMLSLTVALWCWGLLIRLWNKYRINYLFMLKLDPELTATGSEVMWVAADVSIVLLWSFIVHFKVLICDFPKWPSRGSLGVWPLFPLMFMIYKGLFPWKEKKVVWVSVFNVLKAPFLEVTFNMNYVGDVLTSLVKPFIDIAYIFCYYSSGDWLQKLGDEGYCQQPTNAFVVYVAPVIILGPYWLRLMQCLRRYNDTGKRHPNIPNALKYALAMLVTLAGVFNPALKQTSSGPVTSFQVFWIMAYFTSTIYSWTWDIVMDWNVFDFSNKEGGYVRSRRVIENVNVYYAAVVIDLILRFFWTWTLIPNESAADFSTLNLYMAPFAAVLEIFRRTMWSVFRLENEQLHNTAGYREVTHIPMHYESKFDLKSSQEPLSEEDKEKKRQIRMEIVTFFVVVVTFVFVSVFYAKH